MLSSQRYVTLSLELHLFFGTNYEGTLTFLRAGFTPKNSRLSKEADDYKIQFERILLDTIKLSDGIPENLCLTLVKFY